MLEKNKDYLEMRVSSTDCAFTQNASTTISIEGFSYDTSFRLPDPGESYVIVSKEKFDQLQTENEQLKKKLHGFDPTPEFKELLKNLYSIEDVEKLEWFLNHVCGGLGSATGWRAVSSFRSENYKTLSKLVGFSSVEEIEDYLVNEAECDTLNEAISKLKDQVKYTCDEWYSANSRNNSWKAAAECNSPKELIEKIEGLEGKVKVLETEAEVYSRALQEWKEITGYPSPSAVKTALESGASWCHAYNEVIDKNRKLEEENADLYAEIRKWKDSTKCETPEAAATWITSYESACGRGNRLAEMVEKLKEEVYSWKNVTGYSTPEDYMHARISGAFHTPFDYTAAWQKATGCNTPEQAKERIKALNESIDESEADYNHLLCTTGFESEGEIEDALDKCDHSTLRKALVDYKFDYEELLKLTGYKSNQDIRVLLNDSEQFVYKDMRELINSLKRKDKFTESNWQGVTGFSTPEKCSSYIDTLEKKLEDIKDLIEED